MSGVTKKVMTGITGLEVARAPHYTLTMIYNKALKVLNKMPEECAYRKYTEQTINERLKIVTNEPDAAKVEEKIGCGQIEELIVQADNELLLARKLLKHKPWEPLIEEAPHNQWKWPI